MKKKLHNHPYMRKISEVERFLLSAPRDEKRSEVGWPYNDFDQESWALFSDKINGNSKIEDKG